MEAGSSGNLLPFTNYHQKYKLEKMNTLKTTVALVLFLISLNSSAQKITGLYKDQHDFVSNKLTHQEACDAKNNYIMADEVFSSSKILIKEDGKKMKELKKDYFGYVNCKGVTYKFYDGQNCEMLDTAGFDLYKRIYLAGGKGYRKITKYYFSKDSNDALQPFTMQNLSNSFHSNDKFIYALETSFHNDAELTEYVTYLKSFKVKYIFNETIKK